MSKEAVRPGQLASRQAETLRDYVAGEVYPYSRFYRALLDRSGLGAAGPRDLVAFRKLPPVSLDELGTGSALLLDPAPDAVRAHGPWSDRLRLRFADLVGKRAALSRERYDPRFKPIHWTYAGALRIGWSAEDLARLGDLGRRLLASAGVRPDDRLVSVHPHGPDLTFWEITLGCRYGGVAAAHLGLHGSDDEIVAAEPTVLVGPLDVIDEVFQSVELPFVRIVVITESPLDDAEIDRLRLAYPDVAIRNAWAPPGVRALWIDSGDQPGLLTDPEADLIELVGLDDEPVAPGEAGEVLWTGLGWRGTAILRLRTGILARQDVAESGRGGIAVRLHIEFPPDDPVLDVTALLDDHPGVDGWVVGRPDGPGDPLRIFFRPVARGGSALLRDELAVDLDAEVSLVSRRWLDAMLDQSGGRQVLEAHELTGHRASA